MKKGRVLGLVLIAGLLIALTFIGGCYPAGTETTTPSEGAGGSSSIIFLIVFLVLIFAVFYFLMVRPQRKRQKQQQELLSQLRKGDRVITAGGIYGVIESTDQDTIVIKVESGALLRVARGSVIQKREH